MKEVHLFDGALHEMPGNNIVARHNTDGTEALWEIKHVRLIIAVWDLAPMRVGAFWVGLCIYKYWL